MNLNRLFLFDIHNNLSAYLISHYDKYGKEKTKKKSNQPRLQE